MEQLSPNDEMDIADFRKMLDRLDGPDDMFPPEEGVREPLPTQPSPNTPGRDAAAVALAGYVDIVFA